MSFDSSEEREIQLSGNHSPEVERNTRKKTKTKCQNFTTNLSFTNFRITEPITPTIYQQNRKETKYTSACVFNRGIVFCSHCALVALKIASLNAWSA